MAEGVRRRRSRNDGGCWPMSTRSPASSPSMPNRIPRIRGMPASRAAAITPVRLALIAAVGPPDWPTIRVADWPMGLASGGRRGCGRFASFGQRLDDLAHEGRQVRREAGGDQICVADDLAVDVVCPGIDQVVLDRLE